MKFIFNIILFALSLIFLGIIFYTALFWLKKKGFLRKLKANDDFLEFELRQYAQELEKMSFENLKELTMNNEDIVKNKNGRELSFWFETELEESGDLFVLINVESTNCNTFGVSPTYTFWKKKDGSVYYGG